MRKWPALVGYRLHQIWCPAIHRNAQVALGQAFDRLTFASTALCDAAPTLGLPAQP